MSNALNSNRLVIGAFTIDYTAYIDGVTNTTGGEENRRPPGSLWHLSIYQNGWTDDAFLDGGPVVGGNENINAESDVGWQLQVNHFQVDDHVQVRDWVKMRFRQNFPRW